MKTLTLICTCDDITDEPCPAHIRENQLQDALIIAKERLDALQYWKQGVLDAAVASGLDAHAAVFYAVSNKPSAAYRQGTELVAHLRRIVKINRRKSY